MHTLVQDLRYAFRQILKSPGFTLAAVLSLGLGIGATTAIFSVVEGVLLRPLPFKDPERLVTISDDIRTVTDVAGSQGVTGPDILAYARNAQAFESLGGYQPVSYELSGRGDPAQVNASRLSAVMKPGKAASMETARFWAAKYCSTANPTWSSV